MMLPAVTFSDIVQWLSQPAHITFLVAFLIASFVYHIRERRKMLAVKALGNFFFSVHLYFMQSFVGAYAVMIAVLSGLVQVILPEGLMKKTALIRNILASAFALIGVAFLAQQTTDVLPLISVVLARFSEAQENPQHIRLGFIISMLMWLYYTFENGLYLMAFSYVVTLLSLTWAFWRYRRQAPVLV